MIRSTADILKTGWISIPVLCMMIAMVPSGAMSLADDTDSSDNAVWEDTHLSNAPPDVLYYRLDEIRIFGNRKTTDAVIRRHIPIRPKDVFPADDERLVKARYKLLSLGLFSSVKMTLEKGQKRGHVNLIIVVEERNTIVIRDLSLGATKIAPNWDEIVPFGSIGMEETSLLGSGIRVGATVAGSPGQRAYRVAVDDTNFMNSAMGLHLEGYYATAEEYFGDRHLPTPDDANSFGRYETLRFRRAGIRIGSGYHLIRNTYFSWGLRFETILAEEPRIIEGDYTRDDRDDPVPVGYLEPDDSNLGSFHFGFRRNTSNHPVLPSEGALTDLLVEISHPIVGSSYDFAKFTLSHTTWFPFGRPGQNISLGGTAGLITGNAPFFDQFFIGDYSSLVPNRQLGLNFSNLHPQILHNSIQHRWYEDLVLSVNSEYAFPLYRGSRSVYGINGFIRFGAYTLTSAKYIDDPGMPVDLTIDFGIRIDTGVGVFTLSFANVLQMIPPVQKETTRE